jgi:hypothetical protein
MQNSSADRSQSSIRAYTGKPMNTEPQQNLGRRYLKSFASGTVNMFSCSANHYAWLAHHYGISRVTIDLLAQKIEPVEFDIKRNRFLAGYCRDSLLRNFRRLKPPSSVTSAMLIAEFGIQEFLSDGNNEWIGKSTFTVILTDDRGKEWHGVITSDSVLAQGDGFGDPSR